MAAICATAIALVSFLLMPRAGAETANAAKDGRLVSIHDRGNEKVILTHAQSVRDALTDAGITLDIRDTVEPSLEEQLIATNYTVNIYRARPVIVVDGAVRQKVMTPYQTTDRIAEDAGIALQDEDKTKLSSSQDITADGASTVLTVDRATPFTLVLYGTKTAAYSHQKTVGDMLNEKNITVGADDTVSVAASQPLTAAMTVEIWRNGKQTLTQEEDVPFTTEKVQAPDREVGYKQVQTVGELGKKTVSYEVDMRNGKEVGRKQIQSVVTKQPKKQVEVVGTKSPPVTGPSEVLSRIEYWSHLRGIDANRVARIAKCESGFNPNADSGYYKGLFQHDPNYWASRAAKYGAPGASIFDAEAQIMVSTAMMAAGGWSHWGCK